MKMRLRKVLTSKWKAAYYAVYGLLWLGMITWFVLLGTLCLGPREPNYATNQTIECDCHGTIVYIHPIQNLLLYTLMPSIFVIWLGLLYAEKKSKLEPNKPTSNIR
jgi:hypothetical protein